MWQAGFSLAASPLAKIPRGFLLAPRGGSAAKKVPRAKESRQVHRLLAKIQDTPAREVARGHSSCILSFDLIDQHQSKRFHVTEIVLLLRLSSQTLFFGGRETTTGYTSAVRRLKQYL